MNGQVYTDFDVSPTPTPAGEAESRNGKYVYQFEPHDSRVEPVRAAPNSASKPSTATSAFTRNRNRDNSMKLTWLTLAVPVLLSAQDASNERVVIPARNSSRPRNGGHPYPQRFCNGESLCRPGHHRRIARKLQKRPARGTRYTPQSAGGGWAKKIGPSPTAPV